MVYKTIYKLLIGLMLLIAGLGAWAMVDGAAQYSNRTIIDDYGRPREVVSTARQFTA